MAARVKRIPPTSREREGYRTGFVIISTPREVARIVSSDFVPAIVGFQQKA